MNGAVRPTRLAASLAVGAAYSWWTTGLPGFSWVAGAAVGLPALCVVSVSARSRRPARRASPPVRGGGLVAWSAVLGALVAWELIQYRSAPRSAHPTLSAFADQLLGPHPVRAVAFAAWLACGWLLVQ